MPLRRVMRAPPSRPVAEPQQRARPLHREERPCALPGCPITWIPASRPLCEMHWWMLPWNGRARWEAAHRRGGREVLAGELVHALTYLLVHLEQDSVPMPEGHQYGAAAGWECPCHACVRVRERARRVAAERYPKTGAGP